MTKFAIRSLIMAYMDIKENDRFLDIGAGTGSVSFEAASRGAIVDAIESNKEAVDLVRENMNNLNLKINLIEGFGPDNLDDKTYDKIFVGGSRGRIKEIVAFAYKNLSKGGIICASFVTLKNAGEFFEVLKKEGFSEVEVSLAQISNMDKLGLLRAENPIFIIRGEKND